MPFNGLSSAEQGMVRHPVSDNKEEVTTTHSPQGKQEKAMSLEFRPRRAGKLKPEWDLSGGAGAMEEIQSLQEILPRTDRRRARTPWSLYRPHILPTYTPTHVCAYTHSPKNESEGRQAQDLLRGSTK